MCKLNSSTAQQLGRQLVSVLAIALMMPTLAGCEGALSAGTAGSTSPATSSLSTVVDAGIVLADRGAICVAFERLGLSADDTVTSIMSSCECVEPCVVAYRTPRGEAAYALLLRFVKEEREDSDNIDPGSSSETAINPVNLGVLIDVKFADGSTRQFTVNLLHTSIAQEVA